jgi:hypothetical protein
MEFDFSLLQLFNYFFQPKFPGLGTLNVEPAKLIDSKRRFMILE